MVTVLIGAPDGSKTLAQVVLADRWAREGILVGILGVDEDADGLVTRLAQRRVDAEGCLTREDCELRNPKSLDRIEQQLADVDEVQERIQERQAERIVQAPPNESVEGIAPIRRVERRENIG